MVRETLAERQHRAQAVAAVAQVWQAQMQLLTVAETVATVQRPRLRAVLLRERVAVAAAVALQRAVGGQAVEALATARAD